MNHHQSSAIIINHFNHHQSSSIIINHPQSSCRHPCACLHQGDQPTTACILGVVLPREVLVRRQVGGACDNHGRPIAEGGAGCMLCPPDAAELNEGVLLHMQRLVQYNLEFAHLGRYRTGEPLLEPLVTWRVPLRAAAPRSRA